MQTTYTVGIDPGSEKSGICLLKDKSIISACIAANEKVFATIKELIAGNPATIVIEDIYPYSTTLKPEVIKTCKFIGEISYRLRHLKAINVVFVPRNSVKKWIFDTFPSVCIGRIEKKINYLDGYRISKGKRGLRTKNGDLRKPSFQFIDDRIVISALKELYNIPDPKPGKSNQYGLKAHSWQALAVASFHIFFVPS